MTTHLQETILGNLPMLIALWTAFTLSWGLFITVTFHNMVKYTEQLNLVCRSQDKWNIKFMIAANAVLAVFLLLEPLLSTNVGDAIVVLNTFYCVYLAPTSFAVARWRAKCFPKPQATAKIPEDHLLT